MNISGFVGDGRDKSTHAINAFVLQRVCGVCVCGKLSLVSKQSFDCGSTAPLMMDINAAVSHCS